MKIPFSVALTLGLAFPLHAAEPATRAVDPTLAAWDLAARFDFKAAGQILREAPAPADPARELASASALLGDQPRTTEKIRRALVQVREVVALETLDPELRVAARYLEARILDLHLEPRDAVGARERYDALLRDFPGHPVAEQAAVPLALSLLHDPGEATREHRLTAAEALLARVMRPETTRDLNYVIGQTRLRWDADPTLARARLLAAAEIGFAQAQRQASLWFSLARLGEETGDPALTRRAYGEFLRLARRDTRASLARARLARDRPRFRRRSRAGLRRPAMRFLPFIGGGLLALAFALSVVFVGRHARADDEPGQRVLRIGHFMIHAGMREGLDEAIAAYQRLHPNVRVEQAAVPLKAWTAWQRAQWTGETTPDIMQIGKGTGDLELGRYYLPLSPWIESPNPYNRGTALEGLAWRDTFVDGLSGGTGYSAALGDSYGIPSQVNTLRLFYNRELLRDLLGRDAPPASFDELLELGRLAQKRRPDIVPLAINGPYAGFLFDFISQGFTDALATRLNSARNLRADPLDLARASQRSSWNLDTPEIRRLIEAWAELAAICAPSHLAQEREDAQFTFVTGRALFHLAGSWDNAGVRQEAAFALGVAPFPYPSPSDPRWAGLTAGAPSEANTGFGAEFAVARHSANPELAIDFLRFLTSHETSRRLSITSQRLPAVVGVPVPEDLRPFLPHEDGAAGGFSVAFGTLPGGNTALLLKQNWHLLDARNRPSADAAEAFLAAVRPRWDAALGKDLARAPVQRLSVLRSADVRVGFAATDPRLSSDARAARLADLRETSLDQELSLHQLRAAN